MQMTNASGACVLMPHSNGVHDLEVDAKQVVAAHAGLAGHAGGDDDDVCAGDRGIVARANQSRVDAFNRGRFGQIQRLALRHAIDDVEQDDVAKLFQRRQKRQCPANLPGPDQTYLLARHRIFSSALRDRQALARCGRFAGAIGLSMQVIKPNFSPSREKGAVWAPGNAKANSMSCSKTIIVQSRTGSVVRSGACRRGA